MRAAVGIDLGGTRIKAVGVRESGEIVVQETETIAGSRWADQIRALVGKIDAALGSEGAPMGLAAPGLAAEDGRSIAFMPGRLTGLERFDWSGFLARPVVVMNDAQASLAGESWQGAARGLKNVVMLTLGTGVGGAAMVDGHLLRGHLGRAGHLGHICLDPAGEADNTGLPGSLEDAIGNCTIGERTQGRFNSTHDLLAAHLAGDADATCVWLRSVRALGCGIASLINVLDPEAVVIGGGIAAAGEALFDPLERVLDEVEWRPGGCRVKILPAMLGEFAGAIGVARQSIA